MWHNREIALYRFGLAGSLQGLNKATTLDFLHILGMLLVHIHSLNMSSNNC